MVTVSSVPTITDTPAEIDGPTETDPPTYALADMSTTTGIVTSTGTLTPAETMMSVSTFFPLGFMWVRAGNLGQVAASGFNVVHAFASGWPVAGAEDYLNQAKAVGLQVIMDLLECRAYETDAPYCEGYSIWNEQEWGEYISTLSTHDNLVAWFLPDEIDDYEVAANLYQWAHTYDPLDRPVFANPGSWDQSIIARFPAGCTFPPFDRCVSPSPSPNPPCAVKRNGLSIDSLIYPIGQTAPRRNRIVYDKPRIV